MAQPPQRVVSDDAPYVRVRARIRDWQIETSALLDTGYDGSLVIPFSYIGELGRADTSRNLILEDGTSIEAPIYVGSLEIIGLPPIPRIVVNAIGDEFIVGRRVMDRYSVNFDHGERVIIEL